MAKQIKVVLVFSFLAVVSFANAQDETWQIVLSSNDTLYGCTLLEIRDNLLVISTETVESVPIESINVLLRHKQGKFWDGAGYGAMAGAALGAMVGAATYKEPKPKPDDGYFSGMFDGSPLGSTFSIMGGGLIGAVGGIAIGGLIGASAGGEEVYELSKRPYHARIMILRKLLGE